MTTSPLTVETALITTAAIEIKTLTVRAKQVTLALFRQLEEKQLVGDDGTLAGTPWGRVNYHPDKCADDLDHMHVVWQDGTELRRSQVYRPTDRYWRRTPLQQPGVTDEWLALNYRQVKNDQRYGGAWYWNYRGVHCETTPGKWHKDYYSSPAYLGDSDSLAPDAVQSAMDDLIDTELDRRTAVESCYQTLAALPQLFIAT